MKALIVAGEASGDLHGAGLSRALQEVFPGLKLAGMGGDRMAAAGVEILHHHNQVSVVGLLEVASKMQSLLRIYGNLKEWVRTQKPDFAVVIDFPGFNFRILRFLRKQRIPSFYFIGPQVWAWKKWRITFLREHVDRMICILPFEEELYQKAGIPVNYVGHPLVESVGQELAIQSKIPEGSTLRVGMMPGSRDIEVRQHLPVFRETALLMQNHLEFQPVLIWAPSLDQNSYEIPRGWEVETDQRYAAMKSCNLLLVASGTSTLEAAILGVPLMIVYRVHPSSWWLGKILVRVPYYGLVNWIAGRKCIPEYIQHQMHPSVLAADAVSILKDHQRQEQMKADLAEIVSKLGPPGALERAARVIRDHLDSASKPE